MFYSPSFCQPKYVYFHLFSNVGKVTNSKEMTSTVDKLTKYPEETAIFPSKDIEIDDIEFARSIDPSSTAINVRLHFAK